MTRFYSTAPPKRYCSGVRYKLLVPSTLGCLLCLMLGLVADTARAQNAATLAEACVPRNSFEQDGVRIFAQLGRPYVVAVPGNSARRLFQVRECVPDAVILPSRRGDYIQAGAFRDRASAEYLARVLRALGIKNARVAFFRSNI